MSRAIRLFFDVLMDVSHHSLHVRIFDECLKDHPRVIRGHSGDTGKSFEAHPGESLAIRKKLKPRIWRNLQEIEVLVVTAGSGERNQYEKTEPQAQMLEKSEFYEQKPKFRLRSGRSGMRTWGSAAEAVAPEFKK